MTFNINAIEHPTTERAILGALLWENSILDKGQELTRDYFESEYHGDIFDGIKKLITNGLIAHPRTVNQYIIEKKNLNSTDANESLKYLESLVENPVIFSEFGKLVRYLYLLHNARKMQKLAIAINKVATSQILYKDDISLQDEMQQLIAEYNRENSKLNSAHWVENKTLVETILKSPKPQTLNTGIVSLNAIISGFNKSNLVILAARPGVGKTALAINFARIIGQQAADQKVAFFSLEMSPIELTTRIMSFDSGINHSKLRNRNLTEYERDLLYRHSMKEDNLLIYGKSNLSVQTLFTEIKKLSDTHKLSCVIIDYLQLLRSINASGYNRVVEVTEISRTLKEMAVDLNVPVIALSQLSRNSESREKKRPMLSDLRDSGSIEQDADIVLLLYREACYLKAEEPEMHTLKYKEWEQKLEQVENTAEIIVAKNRHGSTGVAHVKFYPEKMLFTD